MSKSILIIDYGMGNIGSLRNMFRRIGVTTEVADDPVSVSRASKLLLPGVGAFDAAMDRIEASGLRSALDRQMQADTPILGVCLGMQLLTSGSDEGRKSGLGWIPGRAHRFAASPTLKVPHMGWSPVQPARDSRLIAGLDAESRFYFVHSYAVQVEDPANSLLRASYGIDFDAGIQRGNIYGVQFHPEKSHRFGMKLLSNFAAL